VACAGALGGAFQLSHRLQRIPDAGRRSGASADELSTSVRAACPGRRAACFPQADVNPLLQGFAPHYDDIDAFVLQLEGCKRCGPNCQVPPHSKAWCIGDPRVSAAHQLYAPPAQALLTNSTHIAIFNFSLFYVHRMCLHARRCGPHDPFFETEGRTRLGNSSHTLCAGCRVDALKAGRMCASRTRGACCGRWRLYAPLSEGTVLPRFSSADFDQHELGEPVLDVELRPGDLMYMPRGARAGLRVSARLCRRHFCRTGSALPAQHPACCFAIVGSV